MRLAELVSLCVCGNLGNEAARAGRGPGVAPPPPYPLDGSTLARKIFVFFSTVLHIPPSGFHSAHKRMDRGGKGVTVAGVAVSVGGVGQAA